MPQIRRHSEPFFRIALARASRVMTVVRAHPTIPTRTIEVARQRLSMARLATSAWHHGAGMRSVRRKRTPEPVARHVGAALAVRDRGTEVELHPHGRAIEAPPVIGGWAARHEGGWRCGSRRTGRAWAGAWPWRAHSLSRRTFEAPPGPKPVRGRAVGDGGRAGTRPGHRDRPCGRVATAVNKGRDIGPQVRGLGAKIFGASMTPRCVASRPSSQHHLPLPWR